VLAAAGVETPALDAELLLRHLLAWDRATLLVREGEPLPDDATARFRELAARRAARRPLQHLTGRQAFWRHEFVVTPDVLIPRPETEVLVEAALERLRSVDAPTVADVGTGSGCIALSLAAERPDAAVYATEISPAALEVARHNAARLGLSGRVSFLEGDLMGPLEGLRGRLDLVACNPPYVDPAALPGLAPEVRDHEPRGALVAPAGVLSAYERLAPQAARLLRPGGWLLLEIGLGQQDEVGRLVSEAGLDVTEVRPDLRGIPRVVVARRR
jgi:release factor glutamine methyltransferase